MIKNSLLNLVGLGAPLIFALFSMPILIEHLGIERFGLLTLIWVVVSYFGLFDLGLGRALTLLVSRLMAGNGRKEINSVVWTALLVMLGVGIAAGFLLSLSDVLWIKWIDSSVGAQEIKYSILYMAIAVPFIVLTAGYRGVLESAGAFFAINAIRIPMGIFTFMGPLLVVLYWSQKLDTVALALSVGRVVGFFAHFIMAHKLLPELVFRPEFKKGHIQPLFSLGGWITVSNIVSPLMGYADRFLIGFMVSAAAVAYYATPNEMITKLWIIPSALTAVIFPRFVSELTSGEGDIKKTYWRSCGLLFVVVFPVCLILFMFSYEVLLAWLGKDFAENSFFILRLFLIGILINCMAHIPYTFIQSTGDTRTTAVIQLIEFPFYIAILLLMLGVYGVQGAAIAWVLRMMLDAVVMFYIGRKLLREVGC